MTRRPLTSTAFLLAAFLATVRASPALADGATPAGGGVSAHLALLRTTPPSLVLAATFPTPALHAAFDEWRADFGRAYGSAHEGALRKLVW